MMSAPGTVRARWVPLYGVDMPDGTHLEPGDEYDVPAGEAAQSDNWQPVTAPKQISKSSKDEE